MKNVKNRSKFHEKMAVFCHYLAMNGKVWVQKKFATHIQCQRWSGKSFMKIGCWEVPKPTDPSSLWLAEWKVPAPFQTYFLVLTTFEMSDANLILTNVVFKLPRFRCKSEDYADCVWKSNAPQALLTISMLMDATLEEQQWPHLFSASVTLVIIHVVGINLATDGKIFWLFCPSNKKWHPGQIKVCLIVGSLIWRWLSGLIIWACSIISATKVQKFHQLKLSSIDEGLGSRQKLLAFSKAYLDWMPHT